MKEVIVNAEDLVCLNKEKLQELIRCKDCVFYEENYMGRRVCFDTGMVRNSNDFCSQAKRKEE